MPYRHRWKRKKMDIRHLRYFVAAAEAGSLQGAARLVNVAQPALSRRIRDLEGDLGCALFERNAQGVALTAAGTMYYREVVKHLAGLDDAAQRVRRMGREHKSEVRIGLVQNSRRYSFVSQAIEKYRLDPSHSNISFARDISPRLFTALRERRLDLAFMYEAGHVAPGFGQRLVHAESLVLAVHRGHRLAVERPIDLADLADLPLVWLALREDSSEYHDRLMQQFRQFGVDPVIELRASSYEEMIDLTIAGGGACITAASTMRSAPMDELMFRPILNLRMDLRLNLIWNTDIGGSSAGLLLDYFQAEISRHQSEIRSGDAVWSRLFGRAVVSVPEQT